MENNYIIIQYLDNNYKILQYLSESNKQFTNRLVYLQKLEKCNINIKEAIRLSKIWYSIKYKNCTYTNDIYNYVMNYDK